MKTIVNIHEVERTDDIVERLIELSGIWEVEVSCYGYRRNSAESLDERRIFIAECGGVIVAYLIGKMDTARNMSSIAADGTDYFEVEEIYVEADYRSQGIGKKLFKSV